VIPYWKLWKILEWVKRIQPVDGRMMNAYAEAAFTGQGQEKTIVRLTNVIAWTRIESDYRKRPANSEIRVALDVLK